MGKPHPMELHERVVTFVEEGNTHRSAAASEFSRRVIGQPGLEQLERCDHQGRHGDVGGDHPFDQIELRRLDISLGFQSQGIDIGLGFQSQGFDIGPGRLDIGFGSKIMLYQVNLFTYHRFGMGLRHARAGQPTDGCVSVV